MVGMFMAEGSPGPGVIRRMVDTAWSASELPADPDDPLVRGFADFGLPSSSSLATDGRLRELEAWRDNLRIPANSAFLDGTLLLTVEALLGWDGPNVLTPVTLWELTTFIDALACFDRLYCIANPVIDVSHFNRRLGAEVLTAIPDPDNGMLRRLAAEAAADGVTNMSILREGAGFDDAFGQEVQAVVDGWRAVLGPDFPSDGPFDTTRLDIRLAEMAAPTGTAIPDDVAAAAVPDFPEPAPFPESVPASTAAPDFPEAMALADAVADPGADSSAVLVDGSAVASDKGSVSSEHPHLRVLIEATRVPQTPGVPAARPPLTARQQLAAIATYRTYVNQGIANALALPYLPGTLRMPFRRLFVRRAAEVQDELLSVALADRIFAQQQPSAPLILPFFTAAVLQRATTREDIWAQLVRIREQSGSFRRKRAELDALLERSQVSADALRLQSAIRDEGLKMADLAGVAQQSSSIALGVVAQTGIVPLSGVLKVGVDAAQGVGHNGSWTRIWRRLFHRHEYFLAQTNSQAIALTNALPQVQQLWQMPRIGGYLNRFASATQQMGHVLRN
jgi:hypothetical protein